MVWDLDKCKLNCRKIKNGVALVVDNNGTESCTCTLNYHWVPFNREWERRNTGERVYEVLFGGIASCPKMFPTSLCCNAMTSWSNCSIIAFQMNQFLMSNKKGIILLIFTVVITHHFYKHGNCCCLH